MMSRDEYADAVLADGPVGYWRLNEQSQSEQITDQSGYDHHGMFVGASFKANKEQLLAVRTAPCDLFPKLTSRFSIQTISAFKQAE
jgi:hypothetical protein